MFLAEPGRLLGFEGGDLGLGDVLDGEVCAEAELDKLGCVGLWQAELFEAGEVAGGGGHNEVRVAVEEGVDVGFVRRSPLDSEQAPLARALRNLSKHSCMQL